jgi:hypothetical protein
VSPGIEFCSCMTIFMRRHDAARTTAALAYPPDPYTTSGLYHRSRESDWKKPTAMLAALRILAAAPFPRTPLAEM